jgi:signal transduction histidine kinase/ligand-binding sensor domain-containing protein
MLSSFDKVASVLLAALVALAGPAWSLDPHKSLTQYTRAVWTQANGLPEDDIGAITQTTDGYLWVGTRDGLARFDGYDFTSFTKNSGALPSDGVGALAAGHGGTLWIGTNNGLVRYAAGRFTTFTKKDGLPDNVIGSLYEDRDSVLWIVAGVHLCRFENGHFISYPTDALLPALTARSIVGDTQGIWVAGIDGLIKRTDKSFAPVLKIPGVSEGGFVTLAKDRKGNSWIGGLGITFLSARGRVQKFGAREGLTASVRALLEDRDGNLWAGTTRGLSRFEGGRFISQTVDSEASGGVVRCLFEDREGDLWVGMTNGLYRFRDDEVTNYGRTERLPSDEPIAVHQDQEGRVWVGYRGDGVSTVGGAHPLHYTVRDGLLSNQIFGIRENPESELWILTFGGVNVLRNGRPANFLLPHPNIRYYLDILEDRHGQIWLGTSDGVFRMNGSALQGVVPVVPGGPFFNDAAIVLSEGPDDSVWAGTWGAGLWQIQANGVRRYTPADGLGSENIRSLLQDQDQTLWIGTFGGGLNAFRDGKFTRYTAKDGLLSDNIWHIDDDRAGSLWLATTRGVCRITKQQLHNFSAGRIPHLMPENYTSADGLRSAQCAPGIPVGAGGTMTTDGRIWVPTGRGLAVIDPHATSKRLIESAPAVHLVAVNVDGRDLAVNGSARLKAGSDHVQFRYTGIHLSAPERVRYDYMLEGLDHDWNSAADRRVTNFNTLRHGTYRFRVRASVAGSASNEASFQFEILPHFYEQRSFLWLCIASLTAAVFSLHRLRLRQIRGRFALVLKERIRIAREIHDTLAQGFFGISSQLNALSLNMSGQSDSAQRHLDLAKKMARHSITESRRSVMNLRDPDIEHRDLPAALARAAREWAEASTTRIETDIREVDCKLPEEVEQNTLRIAQEAVANALKHAHADTIRIRLQVADQRLELTVEDNGRGFELSGAFSMINGHYGLLGMRERAEQMGGQVQLTSAPHCGTVIKFSIPVSAGLHRDSLWRWFIAEIKGWRRPLIPWFKGNRSGF